MNREQREANAQTVEQQVGHVSCGLYGGCSKCQRDYGMKPREFYQAVHVEQTVIDEGSFSWNKCELCDSTLGGDRYAAHAIDENRCVTHLEVCVDCLMSTANGEPYPEKEK